MKKILFALPLALLVVLTGCTIMDSSATVKFQPMQCEETPWEEWYAEGNIQFIKAPTDSELITAYYSNVYKIELKEVKKIEAGNAVCEACNICPTSYYFTAVVKNSDVGKMAESKWIKI